jgi:hypothetical protein
MTRLVMARKRRLYVGVTGHRPNRMPEREWRRIRQDLSQVMAEIETANAGRQPVLVSGLAEGADRLAAFVALGRGWALRAVLPFESSRFEADFADPHSIGEFRSLVKSSDKVEIADASARSERPAEEAYDAVGQRLLKLCDVLIAVWDGGISRGRGGAVDVIERARRKRVPVIWVHAKQPQRPQTLPNAVGT